MIRRTARETAAPRRAPASASARGDTAGRHRHPLLALVAGATALLMVVLSAVGLTANPAGAAENPFTLAVVEGGGEVFIGDNPEPLVIEQPTTLVGNLDDVTGEISDVVFSTPPIEFQRESSGLLVDVTATFDQIGTGEGQADGLGNVSIDLDLTLNLHLNVQGGAIITDCKSTPISLDLVQTAPRDPVTEQVELADPLFAIPPVTNDGICNPAVIAPVNETLAGPNNSISMLVGGAMVLPPPPGDPSTTGLTSSVPSTPLGQPVTFTAQVDPAEATGSVTFRDGAASLGQVPVEAGGTASLTTSTLSVGEHSITARYSGDADYGPSTSPPVVHTVTAVPNITADLPPFVVVGAPPTEFTATVSNPAEGGPLPNLRVDLTFGPLFGLANGDLVLEHDGDGDDTYEPVALTGNDTQTASYGGLTGFSLPAGEERAIPFRISAASDAFEGNLPVQVELNSVDATTGDVVTTLSSTSGQTAIVPEGRRPTTADLQLVSGLGGSTTIRQGDSLQIGGEVVRGGAAPEPDITGDVEILIDGVAVPVKVDAADPAPAQTRNPIQSSGFVNAFIFGGGGAPTADLAPGTHIVTVRYLGDDKYRPAVSDSVTFDVVPFVGEHYDCLLDLVILRVPIHGRVEVQADLPASAPAGSTVDAARVEVRYFLEPLGLAFEAPPEEYSDQTMAVSPGGTGTFSHSSGLPPPSANEDAAELVGETIVDIPIEGAPGDVVDVDLDSFLFRLPAIPGVNGTISCEASDEGENMGSVLVSGTTLEVEGSGPFEEGLMVPLVASVFPSDASGIVQFFSGDDSVGFAPLTGGVARLNATNLDEGTHSITARYLGDLTTPPMTSNAVEVVVRDAILCRDIAETGDAAVVRLVYLELLDRCPDPGGFEFWVDALDAGTTPGAFARQIAGSEEARKVVANDGYNTMLSRDGTPADLTFWAEFLRTRPYHRMLAAMGNSGEYWQLSGANNAGFVTRTYQRLLLRAPEPAGLSYWVARLAAGESRVVMLNEFTRLEEPMVTVIVQSYDEILGRAPSAGEIETQLGLYRPNGNRSALYARLIGTQEFIDRAQGFPNPD